MAPSRTLSPLARWVWRAQQVGLWGALLVAGVIAASQLDTLGPLPWLIPLAGLLIGTAAVPPLRWARWRWDVGEEGIDIRHGAIAERRTLVPWVRVQHVETRRGLLEQGFGLSTVVVHNAAGSHTIPLLPLAEAEELRERIAGLARSDEDEHAAEHADATRADGEPGAADADRPPAVGEPGAAGTDAPPADGEPRA